ncbi:MAG TPA: N-acetylmuramic acid 6-phosphate etherase [Bacteroidia bacterium]|nr:N-acetylmuramic acid 6-phosphate etherase [Bacteroidota bacterium]MCE7955874.1 N-acetylmuramic acid 6-phosphate etherase [Bacteroidetes bacterium CHB6]HNR49471.1 N-acetylmuramic acid 6-phosphate etherase [Bacteroidia bacterium]HNT83066.1 N-acetylmuramic acid 6-phosphate etherase [Bacteroidia bacterium]
MPADKNKFLRTTEKDSHYRHLEKMKVTELLLNINKEDHTVPRIIRKNISSVEALTKIVIRKMKAGGRLFYIGAGTSGRLGIVDASECPPTYGIAHGRVIGLIAGGDSAIRKAVEFAEDSELQGWLDLKKYKVSKKDIVIGIAASGTTPYVVGALKKCIEHKITTGCIVCNRNSPVASFADYPVEIVTGPEFVTGSTRMKAGTAQKLVLNMISTSVMIKLGRVKDNKMVDMQLTNNKLVNRGERMIMEELKIPAAKAKALLKKHGSVRNVIKKYKP